MVHERPIWQFNVILASSVSMNPIRNFLFIYLLVFVSAGTVCGQASWEQFGQNRVQYRTFEWSYYDSLHFRSFYYDQGKANAMYCLNIAETELSNILYVMGGRLNKKLNIILYNSFGDYRQTNIGRQSDAINEANGGKYDVVGDNIPVYFNGDHNHLKKQIRKGIAVVIKNNMLFGDNLKDMVRNAVKMNLPEWFVSGYVDYISDEWTPEQQAALEALVLSKKNPRFIDLSLANPTLVGHSFWNYFGDTYGDKAISNLLYLTRYRKSVNAALEIVVHKPNKTIYNEWENYVQKTVVVNSSLAKDTLRSFLSSIKVKQGAAYSNYALSPSGKDLAYVVKKDGEYSVYVQDTRYGKNFVIVEGGIKAAKELEDPNYPILTWSRSGRKLAVLYQKRNALNLRIFTNGSRKMENRIVPPRKVERITGMCFNEDESTLIVAAIKKGQSDLYKLTIKNNRIEPITQDLFDDKNPMWVQNGIYTGVLFMSNRTTPYLGENAKSDAFNPQFNIYLYDPSRGTKLLQLSNTNTELVQPIQWGMESFAYLQNEGGHLSRKIVEVKKRQQLGDTFDVFSSRPLPFNLIWQEYIHEKASILEVAHQGKEIQLYLTPVNTMVQADARFRDSLAQVPVASDSLMSPVAMEENHDYLTEFDQDTSSSAFLESMFATTFSRTSRYQLYLGAQQQIKPRKYNTSFTPDFIQTTLDNTLLFTRYQTFGYNGGQFQNQPLSGFITSTLTDVMEDYKITGGLRLSADIRSLDYFLRFENFRKRTDWGILYFHSARTNLYDFRDGVPPNFSPYAVQGKVGTDYLQANWNYPFDILKSIRLSFGLRYDRIRIKAQDKYSIGIEDDLQLWTVSRAEFVYDNTIHPLRNIYKGSRAKLFAEYQYKVYNDAQGFYNFGYDARNYTGLYKNVILASRLAGAHSGGNAKILYFLGGVDNDLNPKFDPNIAIDFSQNYAFQSLATNMRGYRQGFRNGNSYMVVNEEIRLPIYETFFKKPIKSGFIRNLQLVAFADIGSAWKGILPNSDNISNPIVIRDQNSPVTVYLENSKYDFGLGYGLGLRTRLLGYFLRTDFAWNIEGIKKPMIHISMATDF